MDWRLLARIAVLRRSGFLKFRKANEPIRLVCMEERCPKPCCRFLGPPEITVSEGSLIGMEYVNRKADAYHLKSAECGGCCRWSASGQCLSYHMRPQACKDYPWYNIEGQLFYDAGCPGLIFGVDGRPNVQEVRSFRFYLAGLPKWLQHCVILFLQKL